MIFTLFKIFYFIFFIFIYKNECCGITTHTEIAHRAASHFDYLLNNEISIKKLIEKYQSSFQAGNPYPDSFYPNICKKGSLSSISEDTHWVPFLNATINYIRKKYSMPYNEDALRLIVFTLGYTSHQIADVTWHSLGVDQGFLSAMSFINFHGSFSEAHSVGDTGGDIVNQFELNTSYISDLGDWYIPYKDLYNIYLDFYGKEEITELDIIECSSLLFIGRLGEQLAISLLYTDYSKKSPFLINKLNDYFLGGIDDMATWTQLSWNKVLYMIEMGVEKCELDHNIININCNPNMNRNLTKQKNKSLKSKEPKLIDTVVFDRNFLDKKFVKNGVIYKPSNFFKSKLQNQTDRQLNNDLTKKFENKNIIHSNATYFVLNDYANLGWSLSVGDFNNDGSDDLIIGAPVYSYNNLYQNGQVFIKFSKDGLPLNDINLERNSDFIIYPPRNIFYNHTRFGHSLRVLDLNQDGINDIVISSPSFNLENIKYQGQVYIYLGGLEQDYQVPSITITCENYEYCNIGWSIEKGDIDGDYNDDLIISSPYASSCGPQCGFVGVLLSRKKNYASIIPVLNLDWNINGNMIYEWFGFNIKAKFGYLIVGAPQSRLCYYKNCSISNQDIQAIGRVYLYKFPSMNPLAYLSGEEEFEQFAYDFDVSIQLNNKTVIAVSSYTKDCKLETSGPSIELKQGGILKVFDITDLNHISVITLLKSDRAYSGFGSKIKFFDINNDNAEDLFISASLRTNNIVPVLKVQEGIVYMFEGGSKFPTGNYTDNCSITDITPCPLNKANIIFENNENQNRFGHEIEFLRINSSKYIQIAISAPRSDNLESRLSGKIKIFSIKH